MVELNNGILTVAISETGAEMHSIKDKNGLEFLWQGEQGRWSDHAPTLFPVVGRLREKFYTYKGEKYSLPIHGFAPKAVFTVENQSDSKVSFVLKDNEETRAMYPFNFTFTVTYEIVDSSVKVTYHVRNDGENEMYFAVGGHPGFNLPIAPKSDPNKYYFEFDEEVTPSAVGITSDGFITREREPFALIEGKKLPLYPRDIFVPTIFLEKTSKGITLKSPNTMHTVHVRFDDFDYLALWCGSKEPPYICIEPWSGTPDCVGDSQEIKDKFAMQSLESGKEKEYSFTITVK